MSPATCPGRGAAERAFFLGILPQGRAMQQKTSASIKNRILSRLRSAADGAHCSLGSNSSVLWKVHRSTTKLIRTRLS